jgi:hypothetical protein
VCLRLLAQLAALSCCWFSIHCAKRRRRRLTRGWTMPQSTTSRLETLICSARTTLIIVLRSAMTALRPMQKTAQNPPHANLAHSLCSCDAEDLQHHPHVSLPSCRTQPIWQSVQEHTHALGDDGTHVHRRADAPAAISASATLTSLGVISAPPSIT